MSTDIGPDGDTPSKKLVLDFIEKTFNEHDPTGAAEAFVSSSYIQHTPACKTGSSGFVESVGELVRQFPEMSMDVKRIVEDGPLVAVHIHWRRSPADTGSAVADFFRIADGRIVEHWDVIQEIPAVAVNENGMF